MHRGRDGIRMYSLQPFRSSRQYPCARAHSGHWHGVRMPSTTGGCPGAPALAPSTGSTHIVGGLPYGDQELLIRKALFERLGGFPNYPVMEDVAFLRAVRRQARLQRLSSSLVVSARRWKSEGPYRTWMRNVVLTAAYLLGASPHRLARWYRHRAAPPQELTEEP